MKILVLNCGSSTLKFQLIESASIKDKYRKLASGLVDRIGGPASYRFEAGGAGLDMRAADVPTHEAAVKLVIEWLQSKSGRDFVDAVGHRVVHGGDKFVTALLRD
jgi:acetate kinase